MTKEGQRIVLRISYVMPWWAPIYLEMVRTNIALGVPVNLDRVARMLTRFAAVKVEQVDG